MERRDIIKDQIEQAGKVIGKMIARLTGYDPNDSILEVIQVNEALLNANLGYSIAELINLSFDELSLKLKEEEGYIEMSLDLLADYCIGLEKIDNTRMGEVELAIKILNLANERSDVYSLERQNKLQLLLNHKD